MGALLNPVGPESATTYWIRRAIVAGGALLLLFALVWLVMPKGTTAVPAAPSPTPSVSASASVVSPAVTAPASGTPSAVPPPGPVACDPLSTQLNVAGFKSVKRGAKQVFTVTATNSTQVPCLLDIAPATFDLTVTSGNDRIFSTADCVKWLPAKKATLKAAGSLEFKVGWNLRRSSPGCKLAKKSQGAGTYVATATYLESGVARMAWVIKK